METFSHYFKIHLNVRISCCNVCTQSLSIREEEEMFCLNQQPIVMKCEMYTVSDISLCHNHERGNGFPVHDYKNFDYVFCKTYWLFLLFQIYIFLITFISKMEYGWSNYFILSALEIWHEKFKYFLYLLNMIVSS
jgi:hypothetical protein